MTSISVIVPVYNNAATVGPLFDRLVAVLEPRGPFEVIFIEDGSADGSWQCIGEMSARDERCVGLRLSRNFGQHPAIAAGLARARGDVTVLMDADLQDAPEELPKLLEGLADPDTDIVYTTWEIEGGGRARFTSRMFHAVFARLSKLDLPANLGTFRAFTALVRDALLEYPERGAVYGPLMSQMGFRHAYVTVVRAERADGHSSYTFGRRLSLAISALISYSSALHRVVTWIGATLTGLSALYLVVLVVQYFTGERPLVNGQLLLLGITVLMSGVVLMTVGVLTAYTLHVFREVLARPRYHVARERGTGLERPGGAER